MYTWNRVGRDFRVHVDEKGSDVMESELVPRRSMVAHYCITVVYVQGLVKDQYKSRIALSSDNPKANRLIT